MPSLLETTNLFGAAVSAAIAVALRPEGRELAPYPRFEEATGA